MPFEFFQRAQRERLETLLQTPPWRRVPSSSLRPGSAAPRDPPAAPSQQRLTAQYLKERNGEAVRALIRAGVTDPALLMHALGDWQAAIAGDPAFPILFLGLVLTIDCSFNPRCLYCNQLPLPRRLGLEDWKAILAEVSEPAPPYVYITGGEPLLLKEEIWGDDGLVAFATERGCAVNINTNAALITPRAALQFVKLGLAKLHISLDSADPQIQGELFQGAERVERVWRGLFNVLIARELLGARHPQIHINCVLTRRNLFQFPDLLRFLLEVRPIRTADPTLDDFAFHLIPVGGGDNAFLRPAEAEWRRFYTETWAEAERVWQEYQTHIGVPEGERPSLVAQVPFANPFQRVNHQKSLEAYCRDAAQGVYWQGALSEHCYVAPNQAYVLPDGSQHWCGAHAIRRPAPLGNVREAGVRENIRRNLDRLAELPGAVCSNCAGATCVINQSIASSLRNQVAEWLMEPLSPRRETENDEPANGFTEEESNVCQDT
jgi:MoaA/NifB/PqqE/SkfB family radical SAM enzyme